MKQIHLNIIHRPVLLLSAACCLWTACSGHQEKHRSADSKVVVASVGRDSIRLDEFKAFSHMQGASGSDLYKLSVRKQMMDQLVYKHLLRQFVLSEKLMELPRIANKRKTGLEEIVASRVRQREVYDALITDSALVAEYERMKEEIRISQVLIGYRESMMQKGKWMDTVVARRSRESARRLADSIFRDLQLYPERFDAYVIQYSNDEQTQYLNGDVGFVGYGRSSPDVWEKLWPLQKGAILNPVESAKGFQILKVTDRRPVGTLKSLDELKSSIKTYLTGRYLSEKNERMLTAATAFGDDLLRRYEYQVNTDALRLFKSRYAQITESARIMSAFTEDEKKIDMAVFNGGRIPLEEILWEIEDNAAKLRLDDARIRMGLRQIALTRVTADYGRTQGITLSGQDSAAVETGVMDAAEEYAHRIHVEAGLSVDEKQMKTFFESRLEDYRSPGVIDYMEIYGSDSATVGAAYAEIVRTRNFDAVYDQLSSKPGFKCRRTGPMPDNVIEDIGRITAEMRPGEISPPFRRPQGGYAILRLMNRSAGAQKTFEQVREAVRSDFLATERRRRMRNWMEELKLKYETHVFEDVLSESFRVTRD